MSHRNRTHLTLGIVLIIAAVLLLLKPDLPSWLQLTLEWPTWVIFAGGIILLIGLIVGSPGMAVPATIVAGIGAILYYQQLTTNWDSWSYMWTLIPGFVGLGVLLSGLIGGDFRQEARHGLNLLLTSAILFAIFGTLFGGLELLGPYAEYGPIALLFLLGLWLIGRGIFTKR
ncbi:MAG: hypothetical protein ABIJ39_05775 [Chloroflexota bacterium]